MVCVGINSQGENDATLRFVDYIASHKINEVEVQNIILVVNLFMKNGFHMKMKKKKNQKYLSTVKNSGSRKTNNISEKLKKNALNRWTRIFRKPYIM